MQTYKTRGSVYDTSTGTYIRRTSTNSGSTWSAWSAPVGINSINCNYDVEQTWGETSVKKSNGLRPFTNFTQKFRSDVLTPTNNFVRRQQAGMPTSYWEELQYNDYAVDLVLGAVTATSVLPTRIDPMSMIDDSISELSRTKALEDVASSGIDILTFIAELHRTRAMLFNTARRFVSLANANKRWAKVPKNLQDIPGLWLEARFGWGPLVGDLREIERQLGKTVKMSKLRFGSSEISPYFAVPGAYTQSGTASSFNSTSTVNYTGSVSYRGKCTVVDYAATNLVSVPITAWELVSYSFVWDWFFAIGSYLAAMQAVLLSSDSTSSGGVSITLSEDRRQALHTPKSTWKSMSGWNFQHVVTETVVQRKVGAIMPATPSLNLATLRSINVVDTLALIFVKLK